MDEKDKKIEVQNKEIARLKALLNIDGTSAGIPTSQTPINKKKVIIYKIFQNKNSMKE